MIRLLLRYAPSKGEKMGREPEELETGTELLPFLVGWMKKKRVTVRGLSAKTKVSPNTINALRKQRQKAKYDTIERLAAGLNMTADDLVNVNPYPKKEADGEDRGPETGAAQLS